MSTTRPSGRIQPVVAFGADLAVVAVFVLVGRRTHHEDAGLGGFVRVVWPFAAGLLAGWLAARLWRAPLDRRRVAVTWVLTVAVGALLRVVAQGRTAEPTFLLVASVFLGACLFGWRALAGRLLTGTARRTSARAG